MSRDLEEVDSNFEDWLNAQGVVLARRSSNSDSFQDEQKEKEWAATDKKDDLNA